MLSTTTIIARLILAAICGAAIGIERELNRRAAGFRTHILVCVGACLMMLISIDGMRVVGEKYDVARIAAQVVSGIGFLGAGTILQKNNRVSGLTTAATLWLAAGIGMGMGVGYYIPSAVATALGLLALVSLKVVSNFFTHNHVETVELLITKQDTYPEQIKTLLSSRGVGVHKIYFTAHYRGSDACRYVMELSFPEYIDQHQFFKDIRDEIGLTRIRYIYRDGAEHFELLDHRAFCEDEENKDSFICKMPDIENDQRDKPQP